MASNTVSPAVIRAVAERLSELGIGHDDVPSEAVGKLAMGQSMWVCIDQPCDECECNHPDIHSFKPTFYPLWYLAIIIRSKRLPD